MSVVVPKATYFTVASPSLLRRWFAVFVRMVWKELRVLYPFWFVVMITINGLSGILVGVTRGDPSFDMSSLAAPLMAIAGLFPLLYAIGFGAMSYANEREEGTWDLLRRISAPSSAVCAAKLLMGLSSALLMASLAWWGMRFYVPASNINAEMELRHLLLLVAASVCLSQMASLLTRSVLWALGLATVLSVSPASLVMAVAESRRLANARPDEIQTLFWSIVVFGVGLVLTQFWLAQRWMLNLRPWSIGVFRLLWSSLSAWKLWEHSPLPWQRQLGRLVAREWMLSRRWLWCSVLIAVAPLFLVLVSSAWHQTWQLSDNGLQVTFLLMTGGPGMLALLLSPAFCGVSAYQVDQRELRFRFLADRGIAPTLTWWSKHMVRLPMIGASAVSFFTAAIVIALIDRHVPFPWEGVMWVTIHVFTSYSLGQLFGQLIRSPIVASFLACLCSGLLFVWTMCVEQIHVPIVFQFAPTAILLAASYLRSRDWMEERRSLAAWSRLAASVLVPFALLYGSIWLYRMSGVPLVDQAVQAKGLAQPFVKRYEPAIRHGSNIYQDIVAVYRDELAAMQGEARSLIHAARGDDLNAFDLVQRKIITADGADAFAKELERLIDPGHLKRFHSGMVSLLENGGWATHYRFPESVLIDLHIRHFSETRQLFRQAARDPDLIWPDELYRGNLGEPEYKPFGYLLALSAKEAARAERWEEAIDDSIAVWRFGQQIERQLPEYLRESSGSYLWLAEGQLSSVAEKCRSPELIRRIIRELMTAPSAWPSSTDDVREQWASWDQTTLEHIRIPSQSLYRFQARGIGPAPTPAFLNRIFPWELNRSRREFNGLFAARLAIWEAIDAVVRDGHSDRVRLIPPSPKTQSPPHVAANNASQPVAEPTPLMPEELLLQQSRPLFQQSLFLSFSNKASPPINDILRREVWYRALILRLALIAWQHEHGQLPERLEDLVGTYLERLPIDPLSGKPYLLVRTLEELKQQFPIATQAPNQYEENYKAMVPGVFAPSTGHGGSLRVARPDGRGEMWIEFDTPSDRIWGWSLSAQKP